MKQIDGSVLRPVFIGLAMLLPVACGRAEVTPTDTADPLEPIDAGGPEAVCGNGVCDPDESSAVCPADCPVGPRCGNGRCEAGETTSNCRSDCGRCGDRICG